MIGNSTLFEIWLCLVFDNGMQVFFLSCVFISHLDFIMLYNIISMSNTGSYLDFALQTLGFMLDSRNCQFIFKTHRYNNVIRCIYSPRTYWYFILFNNADMKRSCWWFLICSWLLLIWIQFYFLNFEEDITIHMLGLLIIVGIVFLIVLIRHHL